MNFNIWGDFQICISVPLSVAVFMYQIINKTAPITFSEIFDEICYGYPTNILQFNYKIPKTALSKSKFRISFRGSSIWNNFH